MYTECWKLKDGAGAAGKIDRFSDFNFRLRDLIYSKIVEFPDTIIVAGYEKVHSHIGTVAAHDYGAYEQYALKAFKDIGINWYAFSVATIKKYATGTGKATKADMINSANKKWNASFTDDNQVDSLFIASLVRHHYIAIPML